jgi:hypothetical protein
MLLIPLVATKKTQVFRVTYWLRYWSLLQSEEKMAMFRSVSSALEVTTLDLFPRFGWNFNNRLGYI